MKKFIVAVLLLCACGAFAAGEIGERYARDRFEVPGMRSTASRDEILGMLRQIDGIFSSLPDMEKRTILVKYDRAKLAAKNIEKVINKAGYEARLIKEGLHLKPTPRRFKTPKELLSHFVKMRHDEMSAMAGKYRITAPRSFSNVFRQLEADDWPAVSNIYARVFSGRDRSDELFSHLHEAYGAYEQFVQWQPEHIQAYADEILGSMPEGSIYFGGTDPGRFVITAYTDSRNNPYQPFLYVVTQNALADMLYLAHVRERYGDKIWLPSTQDANYAFQKYVQDVEAGRVPAGAEVTRTPDGRVHVEGVQGVMMINGILAKLIFEANKDDHPFFVEESYVIPWMYPYLEPQGLIFKLNKEPADKLTPRVVKKDRKYWDRLCKKLLADPKFMADEAACRTYSKLRSAIAGLYAAWRMYEEAEYGFKQAVEIYPLSPEANFRLADVYMQQHQYVEAQQLIETFLRKDPDNSQIREFLKQIKTTRLADGRREELENLVTTGQASTKETLELAELYQKLRMTKEYEKLTAEILNDPRIPAPAYLGVANLHRRYGRPDLQAVAFQRYLAREPEDSRGWLELAALQAEIARPEAAIRSLEEAVKQGGDAMRDRIRLDPRFNVLHRDPGYIKIVGE